MSERGKRVFRFLLDQERDADVIGRIEAKQPMTGYVRELVRRDMHDERLDYAALKASELLAENARLRELALELYYCTTSGECDECPVNGGGAVHLMPDTICDTMHDRMCELGVTDHD